MFKLNTFAEVELKRQIGFPGMDACVKTFPRTIPLRFCAVKIMISAVQITVICPLQKIRGNFKNVPKVVFHIFIRAKVTQQNLKLVEVLGLAR